MSESKPWPPPERELARQFAAICANQGEEMADYCMEEARSFMWGMCAERYILPRMERVYALLVQLGAVENSELDFNDLDDGAFFIPVETVQKTLKSRSPGLADFTYETVIKVIVHKTQNRDYLYIVSEELGHKRLDIRRIWRVFDPEFAYPEPDEMLGSISNVLGHLSHLEDFTDHPRDDEQGVWRSDRPSLEVYRKLGFRIPNTDEPFRQINVYGDVRDNGYVLSYQQHSGIDFETKTLKPPLDYEFLEAKHVSPDANMIMSCYLPALQLACEEALEEKGH